METEKTIAMEREHIMQSYSRFNIVIKKGKGCYVFDSEGKEYLDLIAGIACTTLGHGNQDVTKAICSQAGNLIHACNLYYTEEQAELAKLLSDISGLKKCFFCNSGTEANEAAIKLAKKITGKHEFIACKNSFHGRTHGSLSATWKEAFRKPFEPLLEGFSFVDYGNAEAMKKAIGNGTAAAILEPIQGEAGIKVPKENYLAEVREICTKKGVLMIIDEVQTGNGRTGKFFAYQHSNLMPDIVTSAKGLANGVPIGVCMSNHEFLKVEHASTFGGNSLACSAALATIKQILKKNLMKNASDTGKYFMESLKKLNGVKEVRGKGLMIGADIDGNAKEIAIKLLEKGLLVNNAGESTLRFLPPITIGKKDIDKAIKIMESVLHA